MSAFDSVAPAIANVAGVAFNLNQVASSAPLASGVLNLNNANLRKFRAALARVRAGTGRGSIVFVGDSTTAGAGAGSGGAGNYNGAWAKTYPRAVAARLATVFPTSDQSFLMDQGVANQSIAYPAYDPRVTMGANWSQTSSGLAGNMFRFTAGAVNNLTFTPTGQFDTIVLYSIRAAGQGSFNVTLDAGTAVGTINGNTNPSITLVTTYTVAKGTHTINIVPVNDGPLNIVGIKTYDSTIPAIDIIQAGLHGATSGGTSSSQNPWSGVPLLGTLAPSLTVLCLTINDSNAGTALATYTTNMQAIITAAAASGDVVLMVGAPSNTTAATDGTLDRYISVLRSLSRTNAIGLIDLKAIWGSYAITNPLLPYNDTLHPGPLGYQDIGSIVATAIARVAQ